MSSEERRRQLRDNAREAEETAKVAALAAEAADKVAATAYGAKLVKLAESVAAANPMAKPPTDVKQNKPVSKEH
ncbi:hypothetical protein JCGZ_06273 [Jatropha curcas]|uniref:Uncharacterized protein n=1 Tax=Jatropha curcas TaxID=180498 RepID=A0A067KMB1_JATCU|nr:hypothetical protein JCGZ_06273 [Jatropha curcas]